MTNKEAIEILKGIYPDGSYSPTEEQRLEAINMAITALTNTQEEPASEDLEDAAYNFCIDEFGNPKENSFQFEQRCFKAGAQWQSQRMTEVLRTEYEKGRYDMREEMMKEAVDANMGHFFHAGNSKGRILFCKDNISHIKTDTKVKLIIIEEK